MGAGHKNEGCEVGPRGFSRVIIIVPDYSQILMTRRSSIIWSERLPCQRYKYIKHQATGVDLNIPRICHKSLWHHLGALGVGCHPRRVSSGSSLKFLRRRGGAS